MLLGSVSKDVYNGPFALKYDKEENKIRIAPGYLRRNGLFATVPEKFLVPQTGIICVTSELKNETWTNPDIVFSEPDNTHYPVGKCKIMEDGGISLTEFRVTVAIILVADICPLIKTSGV